jgi:hypothetical protein
VKYFHWLVVVSVLSGGLVACGDDTADQPVIDIRSDDNNRQPDPMPEPDPVPEESVELIAITDVTLSADPLTEVSLEVLLRTVTTQTALSETEIRFTILQAPNASASLSVDSLATNAEGRAKVTLDVGDAAGVLVVRAQAANVSPVQFTINIADVAPGDIRVEILTPANAAPQLAPFRVRAYPATQFTCATFPRLADSQGFVVGTSAQGTLVTLTDVPADAAYTVTVQAMGNGLSPLAAGCADAVPVRTSQTTNVQISIDLVPLDPTGTYDVRGFWDLSEAISQSGGAGSIIVGFIDFLANPGLFVYNFVITQIQNSTSFDVMTLLNAFGAQTLISDAINDFIFQDATLQKFRDVGIGLQQMLNNLEVESKLVIDKRMADFSFEGYEHWEKIIINASWNCPVGSPAGCGRYEIPVDPAGNLPGLGNVNYLWSGTVTDYDQLHINSHAFNFAYGALLLTIIEQVAIPQLTGGNANTLAGALSYWVDCPGIAQSVAGNLLCLTPTQCLGQTIVEQACVGAMNGIAASVSAPLLNQSVSFDLEFTGGATLVDGQSEGFVDNIVDGHNVGTMVSTGAPVDVLWSAVLEGI